jgi:hypothetical protein
MLIVGFLFAKWPDGHARTLWRPANGVLNGILKNFLRPAMRDFRLSWRNAAP